MDTPVLVALGIAAVGLVLLVAAVVGARMQRRDRPELSADGQRTLDAINERIEEDDDGRLR